MEKRKATQQEINALADMTQTTSNRRTSPSSYHLVCLQFLGMMLSQAGECCSDPEFFTQGVVGVQDRWVVHQLAPHAGDNVTRLAVDLRVALRPDAPTSISSFTLCLWFKVISFRDLSCLLSYALSAENDGAITIFVRPSGVEVFYGKISVRHELSVRPLWWFPMCVVVRPRTLAVWVAGEEQLLNRNIPALPLNGFLVLGQEQDDLDSGFDSNQAFDGHVTGLTLWSHVLTSHQLQVWAACEATDGAEAYLTWDNIMNVPVELRLQGLCDAESPRNWSFIITSTGSEDHESSIYLHGYGDYHIMQNNYSSSWCLSDGRGKSIACATSRGLPLGRHLWRVLYNPCKKTFQNSVQLSLSTCTPEYFTCQDSSCIHLSRLCNNVLDCQDGIDEENCFTCIKPAGYVLAIPPVVPVQLMVTVSVTRIGSTNLLTSTIELDVTLTVTWTDHRLEFRHLHNSTGTPVIVEDDNKVWMPTFKVERGSLTQREKEHGLEIQKKTNGTVVDGAHITYSGAKNPLMLIMDLDIVSHCHFDLKRYPWDVQECDVSLQVMKLFKSQVEVLEDSLVRSYPKRLVEYDIRACELIPVAGGFVIKLVMERYGTLFLPVERFPERGTMSLTTLLVFISLYTDVSSSLPNTSYVKYIDVWFVYNIVFLSLIIATHLLACGSIHGTEVGPWVAPQAPKGSTDCNRRENFILKVTRIAFGVATFLFLIGYFIAAMH
ncbi:hypothetical protein O3P69_003202 [Scylla paramamosain]|uniref:Pentraxin (PTX) domain-containing protein n=1 Tax=Scylla paramamosain TaxID=85552 RepID=A0AAW0UKX8_SCYPA